jgi:hypothetical protein
MRAKKRRAVGLNVPLAPAIVGLMLGAFAATGPAAAQDCAPVTDGLVSWWAAEGDATDLVGTNNGILQGNVTFTDGMVGQAFSLDGETAYIQIPHDISLNPSGAFSVDAWIQADSQQTDSQSLIFDKSHGWVDGTGWAFQTNPDGTACFFYGTGGSGDPSNFHGACTVTSVLDDQWHHIAGVFTGSEFQVYLDGAQEGALVFSTPIVNNTRDAAIGRSWGGGTPRRYFRGLVDEVDFFARALGPDEVQAIVNAGSAGKCQPGQ